MNYCAVSEKQTRDESTYTYGIWNTWKRKKGESKNEPNIDVVSTWPLGLIIPCYLQQLKLFNPFAYSSESSYNYFCYFSVSLALSTYIAYMNSLFCAFWSFYRCDEASPSHIGLILVALQHIYVHPFGSSTLCSLSDLFALCIWLFLFAIFCILYETPYFASIFYIITTIDVVLLLLQLVVFVMKLRTFHYSFACSVWNNNRKKWKSLNKSNGKIHISTLWWGACYWYAKSVKSAYNEICGSQSLESFSQFPFVMNIVQFHALKNISSTLQTNGITTINIRYFMIKICIFLPSSSSVARHSYFIACSMEMKTLILFI